MFKNSLVAFILLLFITAIYTSCQDEKIIKETDTVTVINTVIETVIQKEIPDLDTLFLSPTADASIFSGTYAINTEDDYASGASPLLRVGYAKDQNFTARTLIKFNLSAIPANATIYGATLNLNEARAGQDIQTLFVHKLLQGWTEGTINDGCTTYCSNPGDEILAGGEADATWKYTNHATATPWTTLGGHYAAVVSDSSRAKNSTRSSYVSAGITNDVKAWYANASSNNGWIIKSSEINDDQGQLIRWFSREGGAGNGTKPKLIITYFVE